MNSDEAPERYLFCQINWCCIKHCAIIQVVVVVRSLTTITWSTEASLKLITKQLMKLLLRIARHCWFSSLNCCWNHFFGCSQPKVFLTATKQWRLFLRFLQIRTWYKRIKLPLKSIKLRILQWPVGEMAESRRTLEVIKLWRVLPSKSKYSDQTDHGRIVCCVNIGHNSRDMYSPTHLGWLQLSIIFVRGVEIRYPLRRTWPHCSKLYLNQNYQLSWCLIFSLH